MSGWKATKAPPERGMARAAMLLAGVVGLRFMPPVLGGTGARDRMKGFSGGLRLWLARSVVSFLGKLQRKFT